MILKNKDDRSEDIRELKRLLDLNLSGKQRFLVERELKCLMSGNSGESNSAYLLNFRFKDSKNWVLLHDLRIEHKGLVAQIDHLLINRFLEMYVLESKNYFYGIKITDDGEFLAYNGKGYQGIESPIEQNKRHIDLLQKAVEDRKLAPTRLGISIPVSLKNYVLVAPNARVDRPTKHKLDTTMVIKADSFVSHLEREMDKDSIGSVVAMAKVVGTDTLEEFAKKLMWLHRPGKFNYVAKFGIDENAIQVIQDNTSSTSSPKIQAPSTRSCDQCGSSVEEKVIYYCRINKAKFNGKTLCQTCQKAPTPVPQPATDCLSNGGSCESCSVPVDSKVVFFCRINKKKFDGKILCRDCQQEHSNSN